MSKHEDYYSSENDCDDTANGTASNGGLPKLSGPQFTEMASEIAPHFRHQVETLTDSDTDNRSADSDSENPNKHEIFANSNSLIAMEKPDNMYYKNSYHEEQEDDPASILENCIEEPPKKRKKHVAEADNDVLAVPVAKHKKKSKKEDNVTPPPTAVPATTISNKAKQMMEKMGYKQGSGLGKHGQGRVAPVTASTQKGRRGLGTVIAPVDRELIQFDPLKEVCVVEEEVDWLTSNVDVSDLQIEYSWMLEGKKKRTLADEVHFCDPGVLKKVLICKSAFDKMSSEEMRRARTRANPFESIKKGVFQNRAAMKMANMDHVFGYMFTDPKDEFGHSLVNKDQLLYFADVCAGPGGFSEYVLWKKRWTAKGFGFTLKGDNDFRLENFYAGPPESFEPYYGDPHNDGDVYKPLNITSFSEHVRKNTDNEGVHFMMADGGFSVEGQENLQEILSNRLYLCQCLVALSIVRVNGHFVCKLFDLFTPFSIGIIYLMYHCFKQISIHKPNTSRPANSERYIICKWRKENVHTVRSYMFEVNKKLDEYGESNDDDILELVPMDMMKNDTNFYNYICSSNIKLGERQSNSLAKILEFSEDENLTEEKQSTLKKACMDAWGIPITARREPSKESPDAICSQILKKNTALLNQTLSPFPDEESEMKKLFTSIYDWYVVILGATRTITEENEATFYLGTTHKKSYKYDKRTRRWIPVRTKTEGYNLELSPDTLVYGELVEELISERFKQRKVEVFHIIDGYYLGGIDISHLHYEERKDRCRLFAKSLSRYSMHTALIIRMKNVFDLETVCDEAFKKMETITMKNSERRLVMPAWDPFESEQYFTPSGLLLIRGTKHPYYRQFSQTHGVKYYWSHVEGAAYERPQQSIATFEDSYKGLFIWFADYKENVPFNKKKVVVELGRYLENRKREEAMKRKK